jgi:hypothetical protein
MVAVHAGAQTRVDLRTQTKSVDFSGAVSTKPSQTGAAVPATCTLGQTFLNTSAQPGQNLYICTAANVWSVQGASGLANYAMSFTSATSVTIPASAHLLGTAKLFVEVYDTEVPAVLVEPDDVQINPTTYDVLVKFATPQSGTVVLSAAGGGGGGAVTSVFGRVGPIMAQAGDYNAAQVTNAAQTNAGNTFTAGTQDFSGAAHTLPAKVGTSVNKPATCSIGEMYFATDATAGQNSYYCTLANTWTQQLNSGSGGGSLQRVPFVFNNGGVGLTGTIDTCNSVNSGMTASTATFVNNDGKSGTARISLYYQAYTAYTTPAAAISGGTLIGTVTITSTTKGRTTGLGVTIPTNSVVCAQGVFTSGGFTALDGEITAD